ncbi:hypothetical protein ACFV2D_35990 [Streptomyces capillispiralis]|uniref:hypothetical protein n=1 Tax=Streptomyces capillispiralis TaxID=68182 RepID=UPI0036A0B673
MEALGRVSADDVMGGGWEERLPEVREAAVRAALREVTADGARAGTDAGADTAVAAGTGAGGVVPVGGGRRRGVRRGLLMLAASVAGVVLGGGVVAGVAGQDSGAGDGGGVATLARPVGEGVMRGVSASGVRAAVLARGTAWGSEVTLELSGVRGPLECTLTAVTSGGTREALLKWRVPAQGWGVPGSSKERLVTMTGTSVPAEDITGYVIATTEGKTLLTLDRADSPG